jgi:hypothetical protein
MMFSVPPLSCLALPSDSASQRFTIQQQQQHPALDGLGSIEAAPVQPASSLFEDLAEVAVVPDSRGRITVYCISEALDRQKLEALIPAKYPTAMVRLLLL